MLVLKTAPTLEPITKRDRLINPAWDLYGKTFGRWTVLARSENSMNGSTRWLCRCQCGQQRVVAGLSLRRGVSKSCGCRRVEWLHKRKGANHPSYKEGRIKSSGGYVLLLDRNHPRSRKGYVFEHIVVMEKSLGRPLLVGETVHHKNGIKNDNRIENLELWSGNHAPGIRVTDMVEHCLNYLRKYAPEKLR